MVTASWRVKYETGPCASDCYSMTVHANTTEGARRVVEDKYPTAYITDVTMIKGTPKMEPKYMGAMEARALTEKARALEGEYKRAETVKVLEAIQDAAKKGSDKLTAGMLDDVVMQRLRNLGYKVQWNEGYDQRDPGYTEITW